MELRGPVDFCVYYRNPEETAKLVKIALKLGFKTVVVSITLKEQDDFKELITKTNELKKMIKEHGFENIFTRLHLIGSDISWLKSCLRKLRYGFHIISSKPLNVEALRFVARDRRVDSIVYGDRELAKFFDKSQTKLMRSTGTVLELQFNKLWSSAHKGLIFSLRRTLGLALKNNVPIVVSSGSSTPKNVKTPLQLASLLIVLGVPYSYAKQAIYNTPLNVIKRNIHRLSKKHIEPGVDIV